MFPRLLLSVGTGFLCGVLYASFDQVNASFLGGALVLATALCFVSPVFSRRAWIVLVIGGALASLVLGAVRFDGARLMPTPEITAHVGQKVTVEGVVVEEPDTRDASTRLTVALISLNGDAASGRVLVIAPAHADVSYGDRIEANGKLKVPTPFESGADRVFDYPGYLAARGVGFEISYASVRSLSRGGNLLVRAVIAAKSSYLSGLRTVLPEPYAGLAGGITAGDKRSVGDELTTTFQRVSLLHILVLSGYNITVVLAACMSLLTRLSRGPKLFAVLSIVAFFVVISGGAPSAMRAAAMAFCAVWATLYGRQFFAGRVLMLVACAMVAWNPYLLAFDPGFQLSALATLGLVSFATPFSVLLRRIPDALQLREITAATLSTQITVLPLLLYQNGMLSLVALPANLLALVAVPGAMAFSAIAAFSGMLLGSWGVLFALPALVFLKYIVLIAHVFASLPFAAVSIPAFPAWVLALSYALLAALYLRLSRTLQTKTAGS